MLSFTPPGVSRGRGGQGGQVVVVETPPRTCLLSPLGSQESATALPPVTIFMTLSRSKTNTDNYYIMIIFLVLITANIWPTTGILEPLLQCGGEA